MGIDQIAARLRLSGAFVTNEVNKLVSDGLLEKSAHPSDGRRVQLVATEKGFKLLTQLAPVQRPVNDALFGALTRDEFKQLLQLLTRLVAGGDHAGARSSNISRLPWRRETCVAPAPASRSGAKRTPAAGYEPTFFLRNPQVEASHALSRGAAKSMKLRVLSGNACCGR